MIRIDSELVASAKLPMPMMRLAPNDGCGNVRALNTAEERSLFATIVTPRGTVDVDVDIDVDLDLSV